MKKLIITASLSLSLSLALVSLSRDAGAQENAAPASTSGVVELAQTTTENVTATDGNASTLGSGTSSAAPGSVTRGTSGGTALLGPDGTYSITEIAPPVVNVTGDTSVLEPAPEYVPEPVYEEPVYEEPVYEEPVYEETVVATDSSAAATETDLDADNVADALEWELGLDPTIADVDGDGVADGDELNIYGTDPLTWDSDGDGIADGEELFGIQTDPLVWDSDGDGLADGEVAAVAQEAAS